MDFLRKYGIWLAIYLMLNINTSEVRSQTLVNLNPTVEWANKDGSNEVKCLLKPAPEQVVPAGEITFKPYDIILQDKSDQNHKNITRVYLGFWGFKPSTVKNLENIHAYIPLKGPISLNFLLYQLIRSNQYDIDDMLDLAQIKTVIGNNISNKTLRLVNSNKSKDDNGKIYILLYNTAGDPVEPPLILQETSFADFETLASSSVNTTKSVAKADNRPVSPAIPANTSQSAKNATSLMPPHSLQPSISKNESKLSPELILQYIYEPDKKIIGNKRTISSCTLDACKNYVIITYLDSRGQSRTATCRLMEERVKIAMEESIVSRRATESDVEFSSLYYFLIRNLNFSCNGVSLCADSSGYIRIPDLFLSQNFPIIADAATSMFSISSCEVIRNQGIVSMLRIIVNFPKSSLVFRITDKESGLAVKGCQVFIDYSRNIINGVYGSTFKIENNFFAHPVIRYRLTVSNPAYFDYFKIISDLDFRDTLNIQLNPKAAFYFIFLDKNMISANLELIHILHKRCENIAKRKERFVLYISNGSEPLITGDTSAIQRLLREAMHILSDRETPETDKNFILGSIPLDSIDSKILIHLDYIITKPDYSEFKNMIQDIRNELSSAILKRNTQVTVYSEAEIPAAERINGIIYEPLTTN